LRGKSGQVAGALVLAASAFTAFSPPARGADHLLITELAVTPTDGEFVEIFNPTPDTLSLANYYLSDFVLKFEGEIDNINNYWHVTDGRLIPDPNFPNDFLAHFPEGTRILPGETFVISMRDDQLFSDFWSTSLNPVAPDFELIQDGDGDGVPGMFDPGPDLVEAEYIQPEAGLSNAREVVVLFYWDGQSDLVQDVDIVQWSNAGPAFTTVSPNKTGVSVDGPDPGGAPTPYLPDTDPQRQELAHNGAHDFGLTVTRRDFTEGTELAAGGNGLFGHDETSENLSDTWEPNTPHSIGSPGPYGPPVNTAAYARSARQVELVFSRELERTGAEDPDNYTIVQIETETGAPVMDAPLAVLSAALTGAGTSVLLETAPQRPVALYRVEAANLVATGIPDELISKPVLFRGYNPGPGVRLDVPRRAFVPDVDGILEITYVAAQGGTAVVRIFDLQGREVFVMTDEEVPPGGLRTLRWNGRDHLRQRLPAGVYVVHLEMVGSGAQITAPVVVGAAHGVLR
jgi:hypothetical protein